MKMKKTMGWGAINISKTYNYIYCAINQNDRISKYSILNSNNDFLRKTHFTAEETEEAKKI